MNDRPVKEIDLTKPIERVTIMAYGDSGSGKTRFIGTCPRPVIFADATEGGWTTIQTMSPEDYWEPHVTPRVIPIEKPSDLVLGIKKIDEEARMHPGTIRTIGVDSLTFLGDLYLAFLEREFQAKLKDSGKGFDPRQIYGRLQVSLREVMIRVHSIPKVHVVWTALAKPPDEPGRDGGILLAGQTRGKAPAACSLWMYLRNEMDGDDVKFYGHSSRCGVFPARGRFAEMLPSIMSPPTFEEIDRALGLKTPRERKTSVSVPRRAAATGVAARKA